MIKTFISHTSSDQQFVKWLYTKLERDNLGLDIFVYYDSVIVGDNPQKMIDEVKRSIIFIPVLSNESVKNKFVQNEIKTAIANNINIFPILFKCDEKNIPKKFKIKFTKFDKVDGNIYEDFSNEIEWTTHYEKLWKAISNKIGELGLSKETTIEFYQDCQHLDLIIERGEPTTLERKTVIDVYLSKEPYHRYFFSKLTNVRWLKYLKLYGYLRTNPEPIEVQNSPGLFTIPQWNVLEYLERVSSQTDKNEEVINNLLEIIKPVTNLKDTNGKPIDNYRTWLYFTKILINLPNEKITDEIIDLFPVWLKSKFDTMVTGSEIIEKLLPKFLNSKDPKDWKKAEKIIGIVTAIRWVDIPEEQRVIAKHDKEAKMIIDPYYITKGFEKHADRIGKVCSISMIEKIAERLLEILQKKSSSNTPSDYSYIWFSSMSASADSIKGITDAKVILTYILKEIVLAKAHHDEKETKKLLKKFISEEYPYQLFKRIVLYIAAKEWGKYKKYFFKIIKLKEIKCFEEPDYEDELRILLKDNLKRFTPKEKEMIKDIIMAGPTRNRSKYSKKQTAHWKQRWLYLIKDNPAFTALYEEQKKITATDKEEFIYGIEHKTIIGNGLFPISTEEIVRLSNKELAKKMKGFRSEDKLEGETVDAFSETVKEAVRFNPNKFSEELKAFEDAGFIYVYQILSGFKDVWNEKRDIEWEKVFEFIDSYIKKDAFYKDKLIVEKDNRGLGGADHEWVVSIISELIQDGTRDDSWAFPEEHFKKAEGIIFFLINMLKKNEEDREITDFVTYSLNSSSGKLITAMIYLALRIARVKDKKEEIKTETKWSDDYKKNFDKLLDKNIIEAYTWLGRFLPSIFYLDKEWAKDKIKNLPLEKENKYWEAFMDGYLYIGKVYDDIYSLIKPHYEHGISYPFKEQSVRDHLIQHICIGYLRGNESLDGKESLFKIVINDWKPEQILEIIQFFWRQKDSLEKASDENEKIRGKIINFWKLLYERYKDKDGVDLSHEDKQILSSVLKLSGILLKIDGESYKWLMLSAPYVNEYFNASLFIDEYLDTLKDKGEKEKTAEYIGNIFLKMLEKNTPNYNQKHIRSIVEFLYSEGENENAKKICNIYGARGYEFLRDIYY